jgi:fluoride exporter
MHHLSEFLAGSALVTVGATLGTPARFFVSGLVARRFGETIPWGTLVVNVSGCLVMGLVGCVAMARGLSSASVFWLFAATGFLGSYTTVSSFALQTRALVRDGENRLAAGYVALSLFLCLTAVAGGFGAGLLIFGGVGA